MWLISTSLNRLWCAHVWVCVRACVHWPFRFIIAMFKNIYTLYSNIYWRRSSSLCFLRLNLEHRSQRIGGEQRKSKTKQNQQNEEKSRKFERMNSKKKSKEEVDLGGLREVAKALWQPNICFARRAVSKMVYICRCCSAVLLLLLLFLSCNARRRIDTSLQSAVGCRHVRKEASRRHTITLDFVEIAKKGAHTDREGTHKSGEMKTIRNLLPTHKRAMTMWRISAHPIICHSITLGACVCVWVLYSISKSKSRPYHWPIFHPKRFRQPPLIFYPPNFIYSSHCFLWHSNFTRTFYRRCPHCLFNLPRAHTRSYIYNYKKKIYRFIFSHAHRTCTRIYQLCSIEQESDYISIYLLF